MASGIIFDCDGVLVDSEIIAVEVELALLAEAGLRYEESEFIDRFMGMSDAAFFEELNADSITRLGRPLPTGLRSRIDRTKHERVECELAEVMGASDCVSSLRIAKAVASSSTKAFLERKLRKTGLWAHFDPHVYSADHVERAKPEPDLFLFAAKALRIPARECMVVEDSTNGIKAAQRAGMRVIGLAAGRHMNTRIAANLAAAGAEQVFNNWKDAALFLRQV